METEKITQTEIHELIEYYHMAQAVVGPHRHERLSYAAKRFHQDHPSISESRAYREVDEATRQYTQQTPPGPPVIIVQPKGGSNVGTILAVGAGVAGIALGAWWFLTRRANPEFDLIQPVASPGVIAVGAQTVISAGVKNISKSEQDVDVRLQIFQAGFTELMGPQIDESTTRLTIAPGATSYGKITHTGTVGGPASNGIAMRHVIIATIVGGKVIGTPWTAKNVFGVSVQGETVSFTVGQPVVNGVSYPNAKVLSGATCEIKIKVTNTGSQPQTVSLHASVTEHSALGTGDAIGTPYTSSDTAIPSGKSVEFSFNHTATGTAPNSRDIVTSLYQGAGLAPNTGPNNPNIFRNAFTVTALPPGVTLVFGTLTTHTPSGTLQEPEGTEVHFQANIKNIGTAPCYIDGYFRLREESAIGTGDWASDEIKCVSTIVVQPGHDLDLWFTWHVAGAVGRKTGVLYLRNFETGTLIDQHDYGSWGNPVIELIVPVTLTVSVSPAGAGKVNVQRADGSIVSDVSSVAVRKDEFVVLIIGSGNFDYSCYWSGDTGVGVVYGFTQLGVKMDTDRAITANFVTPAPPPWTKVSVYMHLKDWPASANTWKIQHFDPTGVMDYESKFYNLPEVITVPNINQDGSFAVTCRKADGSLLPTSYSSQVQVANYAVYIFLFPSGTLENWWG